MYNNNAGKDCEKLVLPDRAGKNVKEFLKMVIIDFST